MVSESPCGVCVVARCVFFCRRSAVLFWGLMLQKVWIPGSADPESFLSSVGESPIA
jgi:hypothetical protein